MTLSNLVLHQPDAPLIGKADKNSFKVESDENMIITRARKEANKLIFTSKDKLYQD